MTSDYCLKLRFKDHNDNGDANDITILRNKVLYIKETIKNLHLRVTNPNIFIYTISK